MEKHNINLFLGSVQIAMSSKIDKVRERSKRKIFDRYNFSKIDTVHGICENCMMPTILVAICSDFYRCTNCGHDTKQHCNGSIRYLQISQQDKEWLKKDPTE